jgi:multidrug efflux pump subunit AcrA (membrane-fusion protein)
MQSPNSCNIQGRRRNGIAATIIVLAIAGLTGARPAFSHGEQIKVGGAKGPVHLTEAQKKKLNLKTATAGLRPMAELLHLNGEVRLVPGRQADVSTRINGQVTALYAKLGDSVRAGQRLARVQSRLVGNPPPSVDVVATSSGVIDAIDVSLGQSVEPATVLFRIGDRSQVNVVARVYEEDLGKVRVGQDTTVRTLSYPDRAFVGKISLVGPTLDPLSRTVEVWISLANPDGLLKPNMFARVGIVLRQQQALSVPTAAVIEANGEKFVFVQQNGGYERIDIKTGSGDDEYAEVADGLVPGDVVVTQGNREIYTLWLTGGVLQQEDD